MALRILLLNLAGNSPKPRLLPPEEGLSLVLGSFRGAGANHPGKNHLGDEKTANPPPVGANPFPLRPAPSIAPSAAPRRTLPVPAAFLKENLANAVLINISDTKFKP